LLALIMRDHGLILEAIASSVAVNHPEVAIVMLLLDQHEDEAAAVRRSLRSGVFFSASQGAEANHIYVAETAMAEANCLVENQRDVLVLVDSLTRLAQFVYPGPAFSGRNGAINFQFLRFAPDQTIFEARPRRDVSGSLTIVAIADAEGRTSAEEVLLGQLKNVAEMQIVLEDKILAKGIFPAVNIHRSRNSNEKLISPEDLGRIHVLRKVLEPLSPVEAAKLLGSKLLRSRSNKEYLNNMSSL
jgi:transcription termination factor Rho